MLSSVAQSCPTLCDPMNCSTPVHHQLVVSNSFVTPWTVACQAPLSMEFSRQAYWSGLTFPSQGDLSSPGIKPESPAVQADSLPAESSTDTTGSLSSLLSWALKPISGLLLLFAEQGPAWPAFRRSLQYGQLPSCRPALWAPAKWPNRGPAH